MSRVSVVALFVSVAVLGAAEVLHPSEISDPKIVAEFYLLDDLRRSVTLFRDDTGSLPISLQQVRTRGYLVSLPRDHWGKEHVYRERAGAFELYSLGANGMDENGQGDDVTTREKKYSCSDYQSYCGPPLSGIVKIIALLAAAVSLVHLIISSVLNAVRKRRAA